MLLNLDGMIAGNTSWTVVFQANDKGEDFVCSGSADMRKVVVCGVGEGEAMALILIHNWLHMYCIAGCICTNQYSFGLSGSMLRHQYILVYHRI
jgi:hypothetical protein